VSAIGKRARDLLACVLVGFALVFVLLWSLAHGYDISRHSRGFSLAMLTAILLLGTAERNRRLLRVPRFWVLILTALAVNLLVLNLVFEVAVPWRINYLFPLILSEGLALGLLIPRAVRALGHRSPDLRGGRPRGGA